MKEVKQMWDYLPPDVWIEILMRLPLNNILQCTLVCKSWYALITSPNFINTHLNRSISKKQTRLLIRDSVEEAGLEQSGKEHYSAYWDNETFDEYAKFEFPYSSISGCLRIVGSCNGLVFFFDDKLGDTMFMFLWNPSIRKFITLPYPSINYISHGAFIHSLGFGFDDATNDYKVVRVVHLLPGLSIKVPPEVELYELSTGSWRRISAGDFPYVVKESSPQAFLNGAVHWLGYNPNNGEGKISHLIVSFVMKHEALCDMMVPASVQHDWDWDWQSDMRVAVYAGSLSLIHKPSAEDSCNVWVMKEYGVTESWTKQFVIDLKQVYFTRQFFFRENGGVLMAPTIGSRPYRYADANLVSYDPKSKQMSNLGILEKVGLFYVVTYMESLVLLKGLNGVFGRPGNYGEGASLLPKEEDKVKGDK